MASTLKSSLKKKFATDTSETNKDTETITGSIENEDETKWIIKKSKKKNYIFPFFYSSGFKSSQFLKTEN